MGKKEKLLDRAQKYIQKGYIDRAISEYQKAVSLDPGDTAIRLRLGELYIKAGMKEEAIKEYTDVARMNTQKGFYLKAIAIYKQVLKLDDSILDVHYKLADLYAKQRLIADAISEYSFIVGVYEKKGRADEVLDLVKKMAEVAPDNVGVRLKLADLYMKRGFDSDALAEYSWIFNRLLKDGKFETAEKIYLGLREANPENLGVIEGLVELYRKTGDKEKFLYLAKTLADRYSEAGDEEKAKALRKEMLECGTGGVEAGVDTVEAPDSDAGRAEEEVEDAKDTDAAPVHEPEPPAVQEPEPIVREPAGASEEEMAGDAVSLLEESIEIEGFDDGEAPQQVEEAERPSDAEKVEIREEVSVEEATAVEEAAGVEDEAPSVEEDVELSLGGERSAIEDILDEAAGKDADVEAGPGASAESAAEEIEIKEEPSEEVFDEDVRIDEAAEVSGEVSAEKEEGAVDEPLSGHGSAAPVEPEIEIVESPEAVMEPPEDMLEEEAGIEGPSLQGSEEVPASVDEWEELEQGSDIPATAIDETPASEGAESREDVLDREVRVDEAAEVSGEVSADSEQGSVEESFSGIIEEVESELAGEQEASRGETLYEAPEHEEQETEAPEDTEEPFETPSREPADGVAQGPSIEQPLPDSVKEFIEELRTEVGIEPSTAPVAETSVSAEQEQTPSAEDQISFGPDEMLDGVDEDIAPTDSEKAEGRADAGKEEEYVDLGAELGLEEAVDTMASPWAEGAPRDTVEEFKDGMGRQLSREDSETHYNLGIAYMEMELYKEAEREFKLALKDPGLEFHSYMRLGICAMTEKNYDEAIGYYQKALKVEGHDEVERTGIMYELALAYESAGRYREAGELYRTIYDRDPDFREVASKVESLSVSIPRIPCDDGLIEVEIL